MTKASHRVTRSLTPTPSTPPEVLNPAPVPVYQTGRIGNFTYTLGGFVPGATATVRLHFAETYWTAVGQRTFNVSINGIQVLTNFDIFAAAGGQNTANIQQFTAPANNTGQFVIQFTTLIDNSLVNGIEISSSATCAAPTAPAALTASATSTTQISMSWSASSSPCSAITYDIFRSTIAGFTPLSNNQITTGVTPTAFSDTGLRPSTTYYYLIEAVGSGSSAPSSQASATTQSIVVTPQGVAIDAGGPAVGSFLLDQDYVGGTTISHSNTINTSKVNSPAPQSVYQTGRIGNFTYTIGGFKTSINYVVRLHFCETYWTSPGSRVFNVGINGSPVLTNFDIFAAAGGQNIANIQQFTEPVNSNGQLVIQFTTLVNNALINGIEIIPGAPKSDFSFSTTPPLETVGVGSNASYTVNLSALNGFTGTVAWSAAGLPLGSIATFAPISTTAPGNSVLTITTSASTPKGSFPVTITGTSGALTHSAIATITIAPNATVALLINQMAVTDDISSSCTAFRTPTLFA